jgi:N-methylhydantoinase B
LEVESYRARTDSGGAGYNRGGHGVAKTYRFLEDGLVTYQDDRAQTFPWGLQGGRHGEPSQKTLIRADGEEIRLPSKVENVPVYQGDQLIFETAGAGGLGDPLTREVERVAYDVRSGLVTVEAAKEQYGVVVSARGEVDESATTAARGQIESGRGEVPEFDFGPLPERAALTDRIAGERRDFDAWMTDETRAAGGATVD